MHFEIVVAHYNENLDWLKHVSDEVTVYTKGTAPPNDFKQTFELPNIGREGHTFLHHIVSRYNTLACITLFLQGDIHGWNDGTPPHTELSLIEMRESSLTLSGPSATGFGVAERFDKWDGMEWEKDPKDDHPVSVPWTRSGVFAVTSETIRHRPLSFWQNLLDYFEELDHANPEEGHFLERFWTSIFSAEYWSPDGSPEASTKATDSDAS